VNLSVALAGLAEWAVSEDWAEWVGLAGLAEWAALAGSGGQADAEPFLCHGRETATLDRECSTSSGDLSG
jgi:hypothetical protein